MLRCMHSCRAQRSNHLKSIEHWIEKSSATALFIVDCKRSKHIRRKRRYRRRMGKESEHEICLLQFTQQIESDTRELGIRELKKLAKTIETYMQVNPRQEGKCLIMSVNFKQIVTLMAQRNFLWKSSKVKKKAEFQIGFPFDKLSLKFEISKISLIIFSHENCWFPLIQCSEPLF